MLVANAFQRHLCVLYVSIALIAYFAVRRGDGATSTTPATLSKSNANSHWNNTNNIYILGLFELDQHGNKEVEAARLAVQHVNDLEVLPGYQLHLLENNTKCDPGIGIDSFFSALYSPANRTIVMLLTGRCSNVTQQLALVVPYWNILQVSFGSISPALSDRSKFPMFFRTAAPESSHNQAKIRFIQSFAWKFVATFSQSHNSYLLNLNHLITDLEQANISCVATLTFSVDNYWDQLKFLQTLNVRIVIASFSQEMALRIFCAVFELGMTASSDYVWILHDFTGDIWWYNNETCAHKRLLAAVEGVILVSDYNEALNGLTTDSGLTLKEFDDQLKHRQEDNDFTRQVYDAVWAMALSMQFQTLNKFSYNEQVLARKFKEKMAGLEFVGLSGPVRFSGGDRIGNSHFRQVVQGHAHTIAVFDSSKNHLNFSCLFCGDVSWMNGRTPIAQRIVKKSLIRIPKLVFCGTILLCSVGILAGFAFFYFNVHYRRLKTVKLSSPKLNNVATFGCVFVYSSVILMAVNHFNERYFTELCTIQVYLLSSGFSLAFGSMFAKTYRVHRLVTYSNAANLVKNKLLKDQQLIGLILIPVIIDAVIIGLWVVIDPMERSRLNLPVEVNVKNPSVVNQYQVEICKCNNTIGWHVALYGYKALILILGALMAWKTRNIKVPALNDSHYIGICIYTAVFSAIMVVLSSFATEYVLLTFLSKVISLIVSTSVTLLLLFVPKIKSVLFAGKTIDGASWSSTSATTIPGLQIQSNTRRWVDHNPQHERLLRLQIQNKVFKLELEQLDKEIKRLENVLSLQDSSNSSSPKIQSLNFPRASWPVKIKWFLLGHNEANAIYTISSPEVSAAPPFAVPRNYKSQSELCISHLN